MAANFEAMEEELPNLMFFFPEIEKILGRFISVTIITLKNSPMRTE